MSPVVIVGEASNGVHPRQMSPWTRFENGFVRLCRSARGHRRRPLEESGFRACTGFRSMDLCRLRSIIRSGSPLQYGDGPKGTVCLAQARSDSMAYKTLLAPAPVPSSVSLPQRAGRSPSSRYRYPQKSHHVVGATCKGRRRRGQDVRFRDHRCVLACARVARWDTDVTLASRRWCTYRAGSPVRMEMTS